MLRATTVSLTRVVTSDESTNGFINIIPNLVMEGAKYAIPLMVRKGNTIFKCAFQDQLYLRIEGMTANTEIKMEFLVLY